MTSQLFDLFVLFMKIGAFSFGGGYAMIPLMQEEVILNRGWLTNQEFLDIVAVAQVTPGPIAVNAATYLGYRLEGILGAAVATTGVVLPSFVLVVLLARIFLLYQDRAPVKDAFSAIRPAILGLIASAGIFLFPSAIIDTTSLLIGVAVFSLVSFTKINPILTLLMAGLVGVLLHG